MSALGRSNGERYRSLFEASTDAIILHGLDGAVKDANPCASRMFGYSLEEFLQLNVRDLHPEQELQKSGELFRIIQVEGQITAEIPFRRKGGDVFTAEIAASLFLVDGEPLVQGILRDTTERKLIEQRLRHSQKMEAIGELAGGVAHDFNNILAAILGNAELLGMIVVAESKQAELIGEITKSGRRAADLTRELLAFAQKGRVRSEALDLHDAVDAVIKLLNRSVDRRIAVHADLSAEVSVVLGDRSQLETAILNLGLNARDAMPEGGDLTFSTSNQDLTGEEAALRGDGLEAGTYIALAIEDTGSGIPKDIRDRIFEPFFSTKAQGRGTGLGLAGTYGCVTRHKGSIEVADRKQGGTVFTILLPTTNVRPAGKRHAEPAAREGSGHILIVDDEADVRTLAARALAQLGYRVSVCGDGQEALEFFRKEHKGIDLILLDLVMPRMSGGEVFPKLKAIAPDVRVLLCSGYSHNETVEELIRNGANGFLPKPFAINDLSEAIGQIIETRAES